MVGVLAVAGCTRPVVVSGLRQTQAPLRFSHWSGFVCWRADSLQPTLRWETFPRPLDLASGNANPVVEATNVTYELTVWEARRNEPVLVQTNLPEPAYTFRLPLRSHCEYRWTVRARFETRGQVRFTQWATWDTGTAADLRAAQSGAVRAPFGLYYWFRTP